MMKLTLISIIFTSTYAFIPHSRIYTTPTSYTNNQQSIRNNNLQWSPNSSSHSVLQLDIEDAALQTNDKHSPNNSINKVDAKGDNFVFGLADSGLVREKGESEPRVMGFWEFGDC